MNQQRGFTLIELLIVVIVIVVIAAVAIPNLLSSRLVANESAAIQSLKSISAAQAQCQVARAVDANSNGTGEYGYFGELAGAALVRVPGGLSTTERVAPPLLSQSFGELEDGVVRRSGYLFRMYLPDDTGDFVPEAPTGGATAGAVDPLRAEVLWCCYAWPSHHGTTGRRAFFVNQRGDVLGCTNEATRYSGLGNQPVPGTACFLAGGSTMADQIAANTVAADGQGWAVVN